MAAEAVEATIVRLPTREDALRVYLEFFAPAGLGAALRTFGAEATSTSSGVETLSAKVSRVIG